MRGFINFSPCQILQGHSNQEGSDGQECSIYGIDEKYSKTFC
jgi:hypothetical protein